MRRLKLTRSPYYHLLEEDENFRRWVESLERGSIMTAAVYFRRVGLVCTDLKVSPRDLASMDRKQARAFIHDLISRLEGSGNVGNYVGTGMVGGRIYVRGDVGEAQIGLLPKREDLMNYLRAKCLEGQMSRENWEALAESESLTVKTLSCLLPESLLSRVKFLFFSSRYTKPLVVERRRLNEEDLSLIGDKLKEFCGVFSLPARLVAEVMTSQFTVIRTKEERPEFLAPPQEAPVEE